MFLKGLQEHLLNYRKKVSGKILHSTVIVILKLHLRALNENKQGQNIDGVYTLSLPIDSFLRLPMKRPKELPSYFALKQQ